jgi:heme-degrading monooxygenase HmoA
MTAFNAVRFKVKAGREQQFLDAHNKDAFAWPGLKHVNIIKTGEHTFCVIAEWTDMDAIVNARDSMIATAGLDGKASAATYRASRYFRHCL